MNNRRNLQLGEQSNNSETLIIEMAGEKSSLESSAQIEPQEVTQESRAIESTAQTPTIKVIQMASVYCHFLL